MALVSPGISISINDQSQYVNSNVGSVPLVLLATAQDKIYNNSPALGTSKANAGKLLSFTSQRDLVTAMGTPKFQLSSAGTPINGDERNEYGLLAAYGALGLGNQLYAIRADVDLAQLAGTAVRPAGKVNDGTLWLDTANTEFGLYELDSALSEFTHISPWIITDAAKVTFGTYNSTTPNVATPVASVGKPEDYALVAVNTTDKPLGYIRLFNKTASKSLSVANGGPGSNVWVQVGSPEWQLSHPVVVGTNANPTITLNQPGGDSEITVNGNIVPFNGSTMADIALAVNNAGITGVKAEVSNGYLSFYVTSSADSTGGGADGKLVLVESDSTNTPLYNCGFANIGSGNPYYCPYFFYGSNAQQPSGGWYARDTQPRPTGSVWWKTTSTGGGFNPSVKKYNASSDKWTSVAVPMYRTYGSAIAGIDPAGGGQNIAHGQMIATYIVGDTTYNALSFSIQSEHAGTVMSYGTGDMPTSINGSFSISATGSEGQVLPTVTVPTLTNGTASDFVTAILAANVPFVSAEVNSNGTITISHSLGGQITLTNVSGTPLQNAGFVVDNTSSTPFQRVGYTVNPISDIVNIGNFLSVNKDITYQSSIPTSSPADGTMWYYSNPGEVDIMINLPDSYGGWKGYLGAGTDSRGYVLGNTDPAGVIVSASQPTSQSDGSNLVAGDLWLDSSDLVNYPALYRYNGSAFIAIDKTDHTSANGIIFADARWGVDGSEDPINGTMPSTVDMLTSDYLDLDAPNYKLYPRGILLFNTRRSGYNVKKFVKDYFNAQSFPAGSNSLGLPTSTPNVTDAWVSDSGLDENGVMKAGSAAQRSIVVAAMQAAVDSNIDVREETYNFNLLVAPGYPELIDNLVMLNDDRGNTGFVIGDTPMTMSPSVTEITAWSNNTNGTGLATSSAYLGVYYPAGLTNDLAGNTVAVPASHAVLRTFLYNDNVSYQWFAPAGVHRGLVSNLSDIGYINKTTGAFVHNGINQGMRDALYSLNINPITQLPGTGLVIWGQETRSGGTTARNKVNVVRLENYLRTVFKTIANGFLFEPNDQVTRKTIARQIESALHDVLSKRGLYDFLVICDTNNNTSSAIANNQLYVDVAVEPMRDVEFIYIPIALYNPGTIANLGASST